MDIDAGLPPICCLETTASVGLRNGQALDLGPNILLEFWFVEWASP